MAFEGTRISYLVSDYSIRSTFMALQHYIMHHLPYSLPKKRGFYELIEDEEQERFSFPALAIDFSEETARSRNTFGREKLCA
jgi:hypothetical protein